MAQLVKCLCDHEDLLHLIPRTHVMPGVMVACASYPSMASQRQEDPRGLPASQLSLLNESQNQNKLNKKK